MRGILLPQQYLEGSATFFGHDFAVNDNVLIPRPETELLVDRALRILTGNPSTTAASVLDLGTGSGNIAISLILQLRSMPMAGKARGRYECRVEPLTLRHCSGSMVSKAQGFHACRVEPLTKGHEAIRMIASDLSADALAVAKENAARNGVAGRIEFIESDLFEKIPYLFDLIVSNPPYVATEEYHDLPPEVLAEPRIALDGGSGGLEIIRSIVRQAASHLTAGGHLLLEIGWGQAVAVRSIVAGAGPLELREIVKDDAGIERIVVARKHG